MLAKLHDNQYFGGLYVIHYVCAKIWKPEGWPELSSAATRRDSALSGGNSRKFVSVDVGQREANR